MVPPGLHCGATAATLFLWVGGTCSQPHRRLEHHRCDACKCEALLLPRNGGCWYHKVPVRCTGASVATMKHIRCTYTNSSTVQIRLSSVQLPATYPVVLCGLLILDLPFPFCFTVAPPMSEKSVMSEVHLLISLPCWCCVLISILPLSGC